MRVVRRRQRGFVALGERAGRRREIVQVVDLHGAVLRRGGGLLLDRRGVVGIRLGVIRGWGLGKGGFGGGVFGGL